MGNVRAGIPRRCGNRSTPILAALVAMAVVPGCGSPTSSSTPRVSAAATAVYPVDIKPENFPAPTTIDNPYYPLVPGTRLVYEGNGADGAEKITTEVTRGTKVVNGVKTVVVHDFVTHNGKLAEDTYDWYAQDKDGSVWYVGEDTHKLDEKTGQLSDTAGSWEFGKDNAQPGIIMKAKPRVGDSYRQEYRKGQAEDQADVIKSGETATVKAGTFKDLIRTKDYSTLDPSVVEEKLFAPSVGLIYEKQVNGPAEKIELVTIEEF